MRVLVVAIMAVAAVFASQDYMERARAQMEEAGMSENEIEMMLSEDSEGELERALEDLKKGSAYSWDEAKGYEDCEIFKKEMRDEWAAKKKKMGVSGKKSSYGKWDKKSKKGGACPAKPKPIDEICADIECPSYDLINGTGCGYIARSVDAAQWVGTDMADAENSKEYMAAFWRLFGYISGGNSDGTKIPMTVPVLNVFTLDASYTNITSSKMYFYLPADLQGSAPTPNDDAVYIMTSSKQTVYSRALGGNSPSKERWTKYFTNLYRALEMDGITVDATTFATAGFTRPYFGRQRQEALYFAPME